MIVIRHLFTWQDIHFERYDHLCSFLHIYFHLNAFFACFSVHVFYFQYIYKYIKLGASSHNIKKTLLILKWPPIIWLPNKWTFVTHLCAHNNAPTNVKRPKNNEIPLSCCSCLLSLKRRAYDTAIGGVGRVWKWCAAKWCLTDLECSWTFGRGDGALNSARIPPMPFYCCPHDSVLLSLYITSLFLKPRGGSAPSTSIRCNNIAQQRGRMCDFTSAGGKRSAGGTAYSSVRRQCFARLVWPFGVAARPIRCVIIYCIRAQAKCEVDH